MLPTSPPYLLRTGCCPHPPKKQKVHMIQYDTEHYICAPKSWLLASLIYYTEPKKKQKIKKQTKKQKTQHPFSRWTFVSQFLLSFLSPLVLEQILCGVNTLCGKPGNVREFNSCQGSVCGYTLMEHLVSPVVRILLLIKAVFCITDSYVVNLLSIIGLQLISCDVMQLNIVIGEPQSESGCYGRPA